MNSGLRDHETADCGSTRPGSVNRPTRFAHHSLARFNDSTIQRFSFTPAFTLIELLVVISIMAILASLVIPVSGVVKRRGIITRSTAEMEQLITAIQNYKTKKGFYPPDNPDNPAVNQLYFELAGTILTNQDQAYRTLDGNAVINASSLPTAFGSKVSGLLNAAKQKGDDENAGAQNFIKNLKGNQLGDLKAVPANTKVLVGPVPWPQDKTPLPVPIALGPEQPSANSYINPWRYNSSSPTNNPGSFDLWIDFYVGDKLYRICNWSRGPLNP
jgi:prepilin-type N-terminal cleavage/methylation domain-containing protein